MFGENNIFDMAKDASTKTKLAELEDKLGVIYSNLVTEKYKTNSSKEITTTDVVNKLEGYEIKERPLSQNTVTGIEIEELTDGKITLTSKEIKELTVTITTSVAEGGTAYYAVIEGKNYEIKLENGKLTVNRNAQNIDDGAATASLEVKVVEGTTVTVSKHETKEKTIVLQAGTLAGETKIKVSYGGKNLEFIAEVEAEPTVRPTQGSTANASTPVTTTFGKIDIIWLNGKSNKRSKDPNSPANYLNGMTPVKWNETAESTTTVSDDEWYSYNEATGTTDSKNSYWANAKTENGSYFVWIPRYAYRITYYASETSTTPTGYYDGFGMWNADGNIKYNLETEVETVNYGDYSYIVHPAFTNKVDMGGWSDPLPGFWFAKFEMSNDSTLGLKSIPGSNSYVDQTIGKFYTDARTSTYGMTGTVDVVANGGDGKTSFMYSHMAKNSEWGAVAYLTHSKYGRNGNEIAMNKTGLKSAAITSKDQSTTGNASGVYDMRGGSYEYVASFAKNGSTSYLNNGDSFTTTKASTKYATVYNGTSNSSGSDIYTVCKTGDGIKEVYVSGTAGWHSDYSDFAYSWGPFFIRGGYYNGNNGSEATEGVYCSYSFNGNNNWGTGFRAVLCP